MPGDPGKLPRDPLVIRSRAAVDAAAQLCGIGHGRPDHLENLALEFRWHPIGIGLIERDRHQHVDDALCHGTAGIPGFKEAHTKR
jgi:hypothetical protein